jgi:hypothetical protein
VFVVELHTLILYFPASQTLQELHLIPLLKYPPLHVEVH